MASSIMGKSEPKTAEELEAMAKANAATVGEYQGTTPGRSYVTDLHGSKGMKNSFAANGDTGYNVREMGDGRMGFSTGSDPANQYRLRESDGLYYGNYGSGGGGTGGGISMGLAAAPEPAAVAAPTVAPTAAPKDWRDDIDDSQSAGPEGMTTDQIVDNAGMDNWMQMGPQTAGQHINALVDPANWQHQVDPQYQQTRNLGRYINPLLDEQMNYRKKKGLLDYAKLSGGLV